jgi:hypothetical protein
VDNLNIISHTKDIDEAHNHLKTEFEMNDLGKTKFWITTRASLYGYSRILIYLRSESIGKVQYGQSLFG